MTRLAGKTAIITGGGSGIGRAICERLAREGASIAVLDIDEVAANGVAAAIAGSAGPAMAIAVDVSKLAQVSTAFRTAASELGPISILVNSAGVLAKGSIADGNLRDLERCLAINVTGTFLCSQAVLPYLRTHEQTSIVNIASAAAISAMPTVAAYSASKGAVVSLTRSMALDLGASNIRVNVLCPGTIRTPMLDDLARQRGNGDIEAGFRWMAQRYPLSRLGEADEVAAAAAFLASDEASFITGAVLTVDGGLTTKS